MHVTKHAKKRMRQRVGADKGNFDKIANRALIHGIPREETDGHLRRRMDAEYHKHQTADNCRFYANKIYVFCKYNLITVLDAPLEYEQNLQSYVKNPKTYIEYKNYRLSKKSSREDIQEFYSIAKEIVSNWITSRINSLPYPFAWRFYDVNVSMDQRRVFIKYTKWDQDKGNVIINYIRKTTGLEPVFIEELNEEIIDKEIEYVENKVKEYIASFQKINTESFSAEADFEKGRICIHGISDSEGYDEEFRSHFQRMIGYDIEIHDIDKDIMQMITEYLENLPFPHKYRYWDALVMSGIKTVLIKYSRWNASISADIKKYISDMYGYKTVFQKEYNSSLENDEREAATQITDRLLENIAKIKPNTFEKKIDCDSEIILIQNFTGNEDEKTRLANALREETCYRVKIKQKTVENNKKITYHNNNANNTNSNEEGISYKLKKQDIKKYFDKSFRDYAREVNKKGKLNTN